MNTDYDWMIECPCGHKFSAAGAERWRGQGGKYLNNSVEHAAIDSHIEVQCPKCLMWLDSTTGEVNDL